MFSKITQMNSFFNMGGNQLL